MSFTGKGIYDVDAFTAALEGKVPESAMLNHDLFEGIFARTGLVTDVELFEEFPAHFEAAAARQHRWARGDWQLLPVDPRPGPHPGRRPPARAHPRDRPLQDARQPAADAAGSGRLPHPAGRRGPARRLAREWTGFVLATMALPACLGSRPR